MVSKGQSTSVLESWFDQEQSTLYDYLVRMMGQEQKAQQATLEVVQTLKVNPKIADEQNLFRTKLYRTARSFNMDCWNGCDPELLKTIYEDCDDDHELWTLEKALLELAIAEREMVFLKYRYRFNASQISIVMNKPHGAVQSQINQIVLKLRQELPDLDMALLTELRSFPLTEFETPTAALEDVIARVERPFGIRWFRYVLLVGLLGLGGWVYWNRPVKIPVKLPFKLPEFIKPYLRSK